MKTRCDKQKERRRMNWILQKLRALEREFGKEAFEAAWHYSTWWSWEGQFADGKAQTINKNLNTV